VDAQNDQVQFISGKHGIPTEVEFQLAMENIQTVKDFNELHHLINFDITKSSISLDLLGYMNILMRQWYY